MITVSRTAGRGVLGLAYHILWDVLQPEKLMAARKTDDSIAIPGSEWEASVLRL